MGNGTSCVALALKVWTTQLDRADKLGFRICSSHAEPGVADLAVVDRAVRRFGRKGTQVTVSTATFEGHLDIVNTDLVRRSLTFGIGRAKSYGCGLLTLARPASCEAR